MSEQGATGKGRPEKMSNLEQEPPQQTGRAGVLIVDDQEGNLRVLEGLLEDLGVDIVSARSGNEALSCLLDREFAVILLDVRMPGMDGIETATFLRCGRGRFTPIIFVSAYENTPVEVERGYLAGAIDYLFSPVDPDTLRRKVSALVDFYLRNVEYKKKADLLFNSVRLLQRKVEDLEQTVTDLKSQAARSGDVPAAP